MKVIVDSESRGALAALLRDHEDPCVIIVHNPLPTRDLLRSPDGKVLHVRIEYPPWEAIPLGWATKVTEGGTAQQFIALECDEARCFLVHAGDVAGFPDLKMRVEGDKIHIQPVP